MLTMKRYSDRLNLLRVIIVSSNDNKNNIKILKDLTVFDNRMTCITVHNFLALGK